jgi:hypothetical protein
LAGSPEKPDVFAQVAREPLAPISQICEALGSHGGNLIVGDVTMGRGELQHAKSTRLYERCDTCDLRALPGERGAEAGSDAVRQRLGSQASQATRNSKAPLSSYRVALRDKRRASLCYRKATDCDSPFRTRPRPFSRAIPA